MDKKAPSEPPIPTVDKLDDKSAYDLFLTACYHPNDPLRAMRHVVRQFQKLGITQKQIYRYAHRAKGIGAPVPAKPKKKKALKEIIIEADDKFKVIDKNHWAQNVADKFGMFIYGKKFNSGVNGAFGQAQTMLPGLLKCKIILRLPAQGEVVKKTGFFGSYNTDPVYHIMQKIKASAEHYKRQTGGEVAFEFV